MASNGIPGFDERHPPLGRLEQLVGNHTLDGKIIGPTDGSFLALAGLRTSLENAVHYLPAHDMSRLQQLEEQRHSNATRAFAAASLPGRLMAFHDEGKPLGLLVEDDLKNNQPQRHKRLGNFCVTYVVGNNETEVSITHEPFWRRNSEVLRFTAQLQGQQFPTYAYQLQAVAPRHLEAAMGLPQKLEAQLIAERNRRQRDAAARTIQAHKY